MSSEKEPTLEEIKFNQSLWHWYPLGHVDAMWNMMEHLASNIDRKYPEEVGAVFDALQALDTKIRAERYPMPKKVKRSNGILRKQKSRVRKTV